MLQTGNLLCTTAILQTYLSFDIGSNLQLSCVDRREWLALWLQEAVLPPQIGRFEEGCARGQRRVVRSNVYWAKASGLDMHCELGEYYFFWFLTVLCWFSQVSSFRAVYWVLVRRRRKPIVEGKRGPSRLEHQNAPRLIILSSNFL